MLVDEAIIVVKAGHGGPGRVSFFPGAKSGPDGGDGGRGGDIYLQGTTDLMALRPFTVKKTIAAKNGEPGGKNQMDGHNGDDLTILVPVGTGIRVIENKEEKVQREETYEISEDGQIILIAKGGLGGRGNYTMRSSRNTTPLYAQPGMRGDEKTLEIRLKLIADFGLIGLPNAGKSSLLNELTAATAKVANYPFTTLEPNLGTIRLQGDTLEAWNQKIIADIPGLIEGASSGKGLGIKFLKHIEKTKVLLHCISSESDDVVRDYKIVRDELAQYDPELVKKDEIILLTKSDLVDKSKVKSDLRELKKLKKPVLVVSIHDWDSLEALKQKIS